MTMIIKKNILILCISSLFLIFNSCSQTTKRNDNTLRSASTVESSDQEDCNWCGTSEAPKNVSWYTKIPSEGEPGEKINISGIVFHPDRITPAEGVIIYIYHTNIEGIYPKKGDETGNGKYHGYLRGWMKTDSNGKYEFETIRPAPYQTHGGEPAHIHYNIEEPGQSEYWLAALWFDDDPRVTEEQVRNVSRSGGFSNVITLRKDENNVLRGKRNIVLEKFGN
jgi:protocatechuate 3,4-dioxygenase beta subunit